MAVLADDSLVNFLPRVDGLDEFAKEYLAIRWPGTEIAVLPLRHIIKSKEFIRHPWI